MNGLLKVWEVIERRWMKVSTNDWGPDAPGDDLADHHVWSIEAYRLNPPPFETVSQHQTRVTLCSTGNIWARRRSYHTSSWKLVPSSIELTGRFSIFGDPNYNNKKTTDKV